MVSFYFLGNFTMWWIIWILIVIGIIYSIVKNHERTVDGINQRTGTKYDEEWYMKNGFNMYGYNKSWYDRFGFDENGIHNITRTYRDTMWYDKRRFNQQWIHQVTHDFYDVAWLNVEWYRRDGYDMNWFDKNWVHINGTSYNEDGFDVYWINQKTGTEYGEDGFDILWLDRQAKNRKWRQYNGLWYDIYYIKKILHDPIIQQNFLNKQ